MSDPKEGPGKKVWSFVGTTVVVLVGVVVLLMVGGTLLQMVISSFNSGMNGIATEMRSSTSSAINMNIAISMFTTGWLGVFIKVLMFIALILGTAAIGKWIFDSIQKKMNP